MMPSVVQPSQEAKRRVLGRYRERRATLGPRDAMTLVQGEFADALATHAYLHGALSFAWLDRYAAARHYRSQIVTWGFDGRGGWWAR